MDPIRVLFVSNYDLVSAGFKHILEATGTIQVVGESPVVPEVIDLARKLAPDILILDVSANDAQTLAIFGAIRDEMPQVRMIALSDEESSAFALLILRAGVLGYLTHREAVHELARAITTVMQGQAFLCPSASDALVTGYRVKARARKAAANSRI